MQIKIQCACGQRYEFEATPENGRVTSAVACPACGADGTTAANQAIAASLPHPAPTLRRLPPRPGQIDLTQAKHEARAKILWGDPPAEVAAYLVVQGFAREVAAEIVDEIYQERLANIRSRGMVKVVTGIVLLGVPIVTLLVFLAQGVIFVKTLLFTVAIGFAGVWLIIQGAVMLLSPKSQTGDAAEE